MGNQSLDYSRYSDDELKGWGGRIHQLEAGLKAGYIYFNNDAIGYAIENAGMMMDRVPAG